MNRKERVRQQLIKNRIKIQQENKLKNETYHLEKEAQKISNPGVTIKNPQRLPGAVIPVETELVEDTVVQYKYKGDFEFAKVSVNCLILLEKNQPHALKCKLKDGRLFAC